MEPKEVNEQPMMRPHREGWHDDYYHDVHCNAPRRNPMGCSGCSCYMFQRAQKAEATIAELTQSLSQRERLLDELSAKEDTRLALIAAMTEKHAACEKQCAELMRLQEQTLADWKQEREERAK